MADILLKITLLFTLSLLTLTVSGQTVERTTFAVFSSITPNDSLLVAAGQIMSGESESPLVEHGYYPLSHTLLSIDEPEDIESYSIYPNPFSQSFQVNWANSSAQTITIEIYSINGSLIERIKTSDAQVIIHTENWERGLYFVRGLTEQGTVFNEKVIKS
ncbi:MAG: T9SS type A sorting domain-containing protein [Crocinitomix sp.]|nr:T9SS type A sorting domain-containing protein [Crocinitomix sp.]